jgi:hypothetical protein
MKAEKSDIVVVPGGGPAIGRSNISEMHDERNTSTTHQCVKKTTTTTTDDTSFRFRTNEPGGCENIGGGDDIDDASIRADGRARVSIE